MITNAEISRLGFKILSSTKQESVFKKNGTTNPLFIRRHGCCTYNVFSDVVEPVYHFAGKIDDINELTQILSSKGLI